MGDINLWQGEDMAKQLTRQENPAAFAGKLDKTFPVMFRKVLFADRTLQEGLIVIFGLVLKEPVVAFSSRVDLAAQFYPELVDPAGDIGKLIAGP